MRPGSRRHPVRPGRDAACCYARSTRHVVHSQYDLDLLRGPTALTGGRVTIVPHGPYDQSVATAARRRPLRWPTRSRSPNRRRQKSKRPCRSCTSASSGPTRGSRTSLPRSSAAGRRARNRLHADHRGRDLGGLGRPARRGRRQPRRGPDHRGQPVRGRRRGARAVRRRRRRRPALPPLVVLGAATHRDERGLPVVVDERRRARRGRRRLRGRHRSSRRRTRSRWPRRWRGLPERRGERFDDPHSWAGHGARLRSDCSTRLGRSGDGQPSDVDTRAESTRR